MYRAALEQQVAAIQEARDRGEKAYLTRTTNRDEAALRVQELETILDGKRAVLKKIARVERRMGIVPPPGAARGGAERKDSDAVDEDGDDGDGGSDSDVDGDDGDEGDVELDLSALPPRATVEAEIEQAERALKQAQAALQRATAALASTETRLARLTEQLAAAQDELRRFRAAGAEEASDIARAAASRVVARLASTGPGPGAAPSS
jgi:septal ring factor EnvC (AmiA/AmiB activator)